MGESNNSVLKRIGTYDLTGNRLGKGNFAYVELATNRVTKTKVAMKVIDTRKIKDEYVKKNILREALMLKKVNHPNIVRLYETLKQNSTYCIVTEFVPGGELLSHLRRQSDSKLSESQARPIMRQLISALYHMHEQGIVHRDLKMENILLDESKKNIKIVDFGLSNICRGEDLLKTQCGSPEYAAPELFKCGCQYGTEVDLWSLGVIMYGIVVGRLPFRSPHFGSRGRNELVDQTSRGLSCTHNKYLVLLTPQCRDLLRKLLEPNPQMRLPLLDVMVHPWVTVLGISPLVPYTEQPIDEKIQDKVLEKVSRLIKIPKSKIALHVHQKRYDAITGVYDLLLDEELISASKSNDDIITHTQDTEENNSVIRVSIKSITENEEKESGDQNGPQDSESRSASSSEGPHSQPETEQEWKQVSTLRHVVQKPNGHPAETLLESLRIRGLKIHPSTKPRPSTATPSRTPVESPSKPSGGASRACDKTNRTRCKSCIPRFEAKFDSKLHGRRAVMSPRKRQEPEVLYSQWESKLKHLIKEEGSIHCENTKINTGNAEETSSEKIAADVQPEKSDAKHEEAERTGDGDKENVGGPLVRNGPKYHIYLTDTPGVKQNTVTSKSEGNKPGQTSETSPKFVTSKGLTWSHKGMLPSSLAAQTVNRAVSPLKASQFVDLADYHKYVPQPPKARIAGQLGVGSRPAAKEAENEEQLDSFSAAYQSYVKNNKAQHRRLSIMQAQEILQHEFKFHSKYGRRLNTENGASNAESNKLSENKASRLSHESISTPAPVPVPKKVNKQQYNIPKPGYLKGVSLHGDQREIVLSGLKREETVKKQAAPSCDQLVGPTDTSVKKQAASSSDQLSVLSCPNQTVDRSSHDENTIKDDIEMLKETRTHSNDTVSIRPTRPTRQDSRLNPQYEESLKRQREKELTEDHEKEKIKFLKELEDQERQKIITEYLQHVYSQYGQQPSPHATNKKTEINPRTYNVSKQGRVYSVVTRPAEKPGSDIPQVITKPTPILHQAARGAQGDKKIAFRPPQPGVKTVNGVRFFNDWNNSVFTEYINSTDGNTAEGKGKDKRQLKDASVWLEHHLDGVLDETAVTRRDLRNYQQPIPRET